MSTFRYFLDDVGPEACRGGVLTIGNFDGVHRGHQALLTETVRQARALHVPASAVIFDPHPWQILRPNLEHPLLTTIDDRAQLLHAYGADHVLILQTTPALLHLEAATFFDKVLRARLQPRALVEGYNFAFGRDRGGTIAMLERLCQADGIALTLLPAQEAAGRLVSSSAVRTEILAGDMKIARELLGRPYRLNGIVATGQRRGKSLGFPTANLEQIPTIVPRDGVYAGQAIHEDKPRHAAINIGPNPTFGEQARKLEVHLLGFQGNLYGCRLDIEFLARIRATLPFKNAQDLVTQIKADVAAAQAICALESR